MFVKKIYLKEIYKEVPPNNRILVLFILASLILSGITPFFIYKLRRIDLGDKCYHTIKNMYTSTCLTVKVGDLLH